jgi:hypothetical protein
MSEFGRRTRENGSLGTDHGTASAQFVFGEPVNSGVLGADPDFDLTDSSGDLVYTFENRQIYSELLEHWFNVPKDDVTQLLGGRFIPLPLIRSANSVNTAPEPLAFSIGQNHPNPVPPSGATRIPFTLGTAAHVQLVLFDGLGRQIGTIVSRRFDAGAHEVPCSFDGADAGVYYVQMRVDGAQITRAIAVR